MRQALNLCRITLREVRQTRAAIQMGRGHIAQAVEAMEHMMRLGIKPNGADEVLEVIRGAKADYDLSAIKLTRAMSLLDGIIGE